MENAKTPSESFVKEVGKEVAVKVGTAIVLGALGYIVGGDPGAWLGKQIAAFLTGGLGDGSAA